jgi:hypothetical protein
MALEQPVCGDRNGEVELHRGYAEGEATVALVLAVTSAQQRDYWPSGSLGTRSGDR